MQKSSTPLTKHIPNFLDYAEVEKGLSPTTTRNYYNFLKMFKDWLMDQGLTALKPHELTPEHIWNYRLYLSRKKDKKNQSTHQKNHSKLLSYRASQPDGVLCRSRYRGAAER
jgi:site-specific recombinase XerD